MFAEYDGSMSILNAVPDTVKKELQAHIIAKFTEMMNGEEVDSIIADYILMMVSNHKTLSHIEVSLHDFVGPEAAQHFCAWFSKILHPYKVAIDGPSEYKNDAETIAPEVEKKDDQAAVQQDLPVAAESVKNVVKAREMVSKKEDDKKIVSLVKGLTAAERRELRAKRFQTGSTDTLPINEANLSHSPMVPMVGTKQKSQSGDDLRDLIRSKRTDGGELDNKVKQRMARFGLKTNPSTLQGEGNSGVDHKKASIRRELKGEGQPPKRRLEVGPAVDLEQAAMDVRASIKNKPNAMKKAKKQSMKKDENDSVSIDATSDAARKPPVNPPLPSTLPPTLQPNQLSMRPPPYYPPYMMPYARPVYFSPRQYSPRMHPAMPHPPRNFSSNSWINPAMVNQAPPQPNAYFQSAYYGGYSDPRPSGPRFTNKKWVRKESTPQEEATLSLSLPKTPPSA